MAPLPFIDEHSLRIDAPGEAIWSALLQVVRGLSGGALLPWLLGCDPARGTAEFAGRLGETVPGFRVAEVEVERRLMLRGRHRFADYALTFLIDGDCLRARTHAAFPGIRGRLYRALVIGSGGHRVGTRRILRNVARAA